MKKITSRGSGILLHVSSLPSNYGIGTFGEEAYKFVDFLKYSGQTYWQILPLGQTSYGDSPYQSFSINAGNPYFIDLDILAYEGLLKQEEYQTLNWGDNPTLIDYELMYNLRYHILEKAFTRFNLKEDGYIKFLEQEKNWLEDYALFMAIKKVNNDYAWEKWSEKFRKKDPETLKCFIKNNREKIEFWKFLQYKFYTQWRNLKNYANKNGIKIIGDIPIYVAYDSVEVWKNPEYFQLDEQLNMISVAGCPPDAFSAIGQLWGNPLYNWEYMEKTKYNWWIDRLKSATTLYDIVRIDHFRGFESYYSIPANETTALNGKWQKGPGIKLFNRIKEELGELNLIAEDLGYLTEDVIQLLKETGYPGMKLMQFAFDSREGGDYLPHNYTQNSVAYIGTHDNNTALGWILSANSNDIEYMRSYLDIYTSNDKETVWKMISRTMAVTSNVVIIQMQDYLGLGDEARMNVPSTIGGNWCWRMWKNATDERLIQSMLHITGLYKRIRKSN